MLFAFLISSSSSSSSLIQYARYTVLPLEDKSVPLSRISPVLPPLDTDEFPEPLLSDWPSDLVKKTYR